MKNLEPSNDNIPAEELALAALLQNAGARGLVWTRGAYYRDKNGRTTDIAGATCCCAAGAYMIDSADIVVCPSPRANDQLHADPTKSDLDPEMIEIAERQYQLGHAFRAAMTCEDPGGGV